MKIIGLYLKFSFLLSLILTTSRITAQNLPDGIQYKITGRLLMDGGVYLKNPNNFGNGTEFNDLRIGVKATYQNWGMKLEMGYAGNEHFTGEVVTAALYGPQAPSKSYAATVTFSPGARTYWHIHEMGQTLIVTEGTGWTQEWGKKPVMLKPGDIVRCPPGVKHWHGGSAKMSMTHIALSEAGGKVTWLEPVSDEDYPKD